jgi:hypothetical protein
MIGKKKVSIIVLLSMMLLVLFSSIAYARNYPIIVHDGYSTHYIYTNDAYDDYKHDRHYSRNYYSGDYYYSNNYDYYGDYYYTYHNNCDDDEDCSPRMVIGYAYGNGGCCQTDSCRCNNYRSNCRSRCN